MNSQLEIVKKVSVLIEEKKFHKAKFILLEFLKKNRNIKLDIKFYYTLYLVSYGLKEIQNSKKYLEKCLKIDNKNHLILNNLGNIFFREGNIKKAEDLYLKSFEIKSDYLIVIINLAILYQNLGKFNESKKFYLKAIELSPNQISLYSNLSRIDKNFIDNKIIKHISQIIENNNIDLSEAAYGYFLLAEYEKKKKNFSKEIFFLNKANETFFNSKKKANLLTLNYWQNIISKKYNKFTFNNRKKNNKLKNLEPIFIMGLPRSGSTMIEVLLSSSNKKIISIGESNIFNGIIAKGFSSTEGDLINLEDINEKILNIFTQRNYDIKKNIFVDKSLENFFYIDIILEVFPKAKFINSFRNLEDNIFAIFNVSLNKLSWTHSLDTIMEYVDNYLKIIEYFNKKYSNKILRINLEDLTNNPNQISKKIYSFCNLKWSQKILEFYSKKDLLVSTASNIQIRENIKKYDFERYKPYKKLLSNYKKKYKWLNNK